MGSMFLPVATLSDRDRERGLRALILDGIFAQVMGVLIGGAFLVAYTLRLGGSPRTIGFLAAISPLAQILQIPAMFLIERVRLRKLLVILTVTFGRALWFLVAVLPWMVKPSWRVPLFLVLQVLYYTLTAVAICAWNSWMRDFVPDSMMPSYFARRAAWLTGFGAVVSLVAGWIVDRWEPMCPNIYGWLFAAGTLSGLIGGASLVWVPEPAMQPPLAAHPLALLREPFRDPNYRALLVFLGWWSFAVNFAAPFFVVYMLQELKLSMGWVVVLSVISQAFNVAFFRFWGQLAERFGNKPCLGVSGTLFVLSLTVWPFITLPGRHLLSLPLLIAFHALAGMSTAGVALCAGNLALKAAPYGRATAYLAVNALVGGTTAVGAPLLAGVLADSLADHRLRLTLSWSTARRTMAMPAIDVKGMDFLFVAAFVFGLYALHRLLPVREQGEVEEARVREQVLVEVLKIVRHISNVAGLRHLTHFPYTALRYVMGKTLPSNAERHPGASGGSLNT